MPHRLASLAALLALSACGPSPADAPRELTQNDPSLKTPEVVTAAKPRPAPDPQGFVDQAAAIDAFELQAADLALKRAADPQVRAFAGLMVRDHKASSIALKTAIAEAGRSLVPGAALPPGLQRRLTELTAGEAEDFDEAYMRGQVEAHRAGLQLLQRYAEDGEVVSLKAFAAKTAPVVQTHHDHARTLLERLEAR